MKKTMALTLVLVCVLFLTACKVDDAECQYFWDDMDVPTEQEVSFVNFLLNTKHIPDSVGAFLEKCINGGWTGWRD